MNAQRTALNELQQNIAADAARIEPTKRHCTNWRNDRRLT